MLYHDYFEPRVAGFMYIQPAEYNITLWISPDYRKKFIIDADASYYFASRNHSNGYHFDLSPRYRISDKITINYSLSYDMIWNNVGYVFDSLNTYNNRVIVFGKRDRQTITNVLHGNFMFTGNMSLDVRLRHYWVNAPYSGYYTLDNDGNLEFATIPGNHNINYNLFNIDLIYTWTFAPGSELSIMWKNSINKLSNLIDPDFFNNLSRTFEIPSSNSFSIKVLYYLDAQYLKKKKLSPNG
jgi:hypothetical protein